MVANADGLRRSWSVRVETDAPFDDQLRSELTAGLRELEQLGREAFNVFPSHYDDPPAPAVVAVVRRLRSLGATSGISRESALPRVRFRVEARRWRGELTVV